MRDDAVKDACEALNLTPKMTHDEEFWLVYNSAKLLLGKMKYHPKRRSHNWEVLRYHGGDIDRRDTTSVTSAMNFIGQNLKEVKMSLTLDLETRQVFSDEELVVLAREASLVAIGVLKGKLADRGNTLMSVGVRIEDCIPLNLEV